METRSSDESGMDSLDERLADLLRAAAPFEVDPFQKRRILLRLERVASRKAGVRRWLRPAVIGTLLISGTATAALGRRYAARGSELLDDLPRTETVSAVAPVPPRARHRPRPEQDDTAPSSIAADETAALLPTVGAPRTGRSRQRVDSSDDATGVVEAIQALRKERDPVRARALLNEYLKTNPRGALSGDALALSIEAAYSQGDPRAAEYARRYLARYPTGKYRDLAKRALEAAR